MGTHFEAKTEKSQVERTTTEGAGGLSAYITNLKSVEVELGIHFPLMNGGYLSVDFDFLHINSNVIPFHCQTIKQLKLIQPASGPHRGTFATAKIDSN